MKNLLLLIALFLISTGGYLQAQCPDIVQTNDDGSCLFLKWNEGNKPQNLVVSFTDTLGNTYTLRSIDAQLGNHYAISDTILNCTTEDLKSYSGALVILGDTCEYKRGDLPKNCPDDAIISVNDQCIFMLYDSAFPTSVPDTIVLNKQSYSFFDIQIFPDKILKYKVDTSMSSGPCDTSMMVNLNDTLFINGEVCTYSNGLLPIAILAFNYQDADEGVALSWKVNSEEPTRKLYLQKSYNGVDWMNVYEQNLENFTSGQTMDGHFMDVSIEQPRLYYRLFISGYSGELKYSNILPVTRLEKVVNTLFYQSQSRSIMIQAGQNFVGEMYLINAQGQNVMSQQIQIQKNTFQEINVKGHLTPGVYFVKFDNGLIPPTKIFIDN